MQPSPSCPSAYPARDFGVIPNETTDLTRPLQEALDACAARGGGRLYLEAGTYRIEGTLTLPESVALIGASEAAPSAPQGGGAVLHAFHGRGQEEGMAFITMMNDSVLRGISIFYPEQTGEHEIVPYPWCIQSGGDSNLSIIDCLLVNPYQGICCGLERNERHLIRNVNGTPLRRGLMIDRCTDVGRIENVHFWPFFKGEDRRLVREYVTEHGEAFIFARTDWESVINTFCWGYKVGYRFAESQWGVCNGSFMGIGADGCNVSVQVDNCAPYGVLITNGQFVSIFGDNPTQIRTGENFAGAVQFNNCAFWGLSRQCARIEGEGFASFNQCHFLDWRPSEPPTPGIEALGGQLTVQGCRFAKGGTAVRVGPQVRGAILSANHFAPDSQLELAPEAPTECHANLTLARAASPQAGARVVEITGPDVELEGTWVNIARRSGRSGHYYASRTRSRPASARWTLKTEPGDYTVAVWVPGTDNPKHREWIASAASYRVHHTGGVEEVAIDLYRERDEWVELGQFALDQSSRVELHSDGQGVLLADAIMAAPAVPAPSGQS